MSSTQTALVVAAVLRRIMAEGMFFSTTRSLIMWSRVSKTWRLYAAEQLFRWKWIKGVEDAKRVLRISQEQIVKDNWIGLGVQEGEWLVGGGEGFTLMCSLDVSGIRELTLSAATFQEGLVPWVRALARDWHLRALSFDAFMGWEFSDVLELVEIGSKGVGLEVLRIGGGASITIDDKSTLRQLRVSEMAVDCWILDEFMDQDLVDLSSLKRLEVCVEHPGHWWSLCRALKETQLRKLSS